MNNCQDIRSQFSALFDQQLDADSLLTVKEHIQSCSLCGGQWQSFQKMMTLLKAMPKPSLPLPVQKNLLERLTQETKIIYIPQRSWYSQKPAWLAMAAALAGIVFLGAWQQLHQKTDPVGIVQALPNPVQPIFLRDQTTQRWFTPQTFVEHVLAQKRQVVLVPKLRVPQAAIEAELKEQTLDLQNFFAQQALPDDQVLFVPPQIANEDVLSGPALEWLIVDQTKD